MKISFSRTLLRCRSSFLASLFLPFALTSLSAAPLTWFAGPSLDVPLSGAAATVASGLGNVLVGGDAGYYLQSLIATNNYWSFVSPLQSVLIAPGAVANADMIIVYGGSDGTNSTSAVVGYGLTDPAPALPSMSVARSHFGYAPDRNGNAYAIGGLDDTGQPLSSAERFDPDLGVSGAWVAIAALPTARYNFPTVFDRTNQIYVLGGSKDPLSGTAIASVLRYSVSGNNWTSLAAMPVAVAGSAATFGPDSKIYIVGGVAGGVTTNLVQVYDPVANAWVISTPLPEGLSAASMDVDSLGRLIVMGGLDASGDAVSDVWRSQQLGVPDSVPGFVSHPATNATYLAPYHSYITATGNPQPTYLLVNGPAGMAVDPINGNITWTPQWIAQIGTNAVTIRATNYAGFADWNYSIVVHNPPPTVLTNLTVVSVTETSVTLSWSPEDPAVGPVTYRVHLRHVLHDPRGSGAKVWYTQIGSATTDTSITISGLAPGLSQAYYITATGVSGTSGYASIVATILSVQPPINLRVTGLTSTSISFAWDASPGPLPAVSYEVWGWDNFGISYVNTRFGAGITNTAFTVTGLDRGSHHNWAARAFDAAGHSSAFAFFNNGYLVYNPAPTPAALSVSPSSNGRGFQFTVQASAVQTTLIQATTNPAAASSWATIATILPATSTFSFTDPDAGLFPMRFYRVASP